MVARGGHGVSSGGSASSRLAHALEAARAGHGATALVAGEAGIGKTRLVSELARRARDAGFELLIGRSIDLVGTDLPYQPFVEALRPVGDLAEIAGASGRHRSCGCSSGRLRCSPIARQPRRCCWCSRICTGRTHRRSISSVFLAHNLGDRRVLLLGTFRADEPPSAERVRRLVDGVRRSGSAVALELGPLEPDELAALLAAQADARPAVGADRGDRRARRGQPVLRRGAAERRRHRERRACRAACATCCSSVWSGLDARTQSLLRLAAAAGRDVCYAPLRAPRAGPEPERARVVAPGGRARCPRCRPGDRQLPLPPRAPGGGDLRDDPARRARGAARAARRRARAPRRPRRRPSSRRTGRRRAAAPRRCRRRSRRRARRRPSSAWPKRTRTSSGRSRCGPRCRTRQRSCGSSSPNSARGQLSSRPRRAARRARSSWASGRSRLVGEGDVRRAALLHVRLGHYLHASGRGRCRARRVASTRSSSCRRDRPSPERAHALAALASGLMLAWRYERVVRICVQALALARALEYARRRAAGANGSWHRSRLPRPRRPGPRTALR